MPDAGSYRKLVRNLRKQLEVSVRHVRALPVQFCKSRAPEMQDRTYYYAGVEIGGTVYNVHINAKTFQKCLDAGVEQIHGGDKS